MAQSENTDGETSSCSTTYDQYYYDTTAPTGSVEMTISFPSMTDVEAANSAYTPKNYNPKPTYTITPTTSGDIKYGDTIEAFC